jgi:hypothetical protein
MPHLSVKDGRVMLSRTKYTVALVVTLSLAALVVLAATQGENIAQVNWCVSFKTRVEASYDGNNEIFLGLDLSGTTDSLCFGDEMTSPVRLHEVVTTTILATYNYISVGDTISTVTLGGSIDWEDGNVWYVPLTGDIQTYITSATAGDTLILGSGEYVLTTTTTVNKALNIVGQGHAGFATVALTPRHGTLVSCVTSSVTAFYITANNVRFSNLSIDMTGTSSLAINTANNLQGLVFEGIDAVVNCPGVARGFSILGSTAIFRDLTFYVTSSNSYASGIWANNDAASTQNAIVDCYDVTGIVQGAATYGAAYVCYNDTNPTYTITLNLSSSICQALTGTPLDTAVSVSSSGGSNNAVVNCFFCNFDGADYDLYQTGTNVLTVGGSVLANGPNSTFGTVTYRSAFAAQYGVFSDDVDVS